MTDPRPHNSRLLIGACVVLSCLVAYQLGSKPDYREANREKPEEYVIEGLSVKPSALEFGDAWEEKNFVLKLPIQNVTNHDIKIHDFALSCGCLDIEPRSLTIPASQEREVALKVDLTQQRGLPEIGQAERLFAVQITPLQNMQAWPRTGWNLHGTVKSRITLDRLAIGFSDSPVKGEPPVTQAAMATVHISAKALIPRYDSKIITVVVKPQEASANHFDVEVSPTATLSPGPFKTELALDLMATSGEHFNRSFHSDCREHAAGNSVVARPTSFGNAASWRIGRGRGNSAGARR
jgi:hypothetical protein